jgi:peptide deformylase
LAAPQVGVLKRVIVVAAPRGDEDDDGEGRSRVPLCMANPEIVWVSDDDEVREEGCLSLPEHYAEVCRPARVRVRYLDEKGEEREIEADGLLGTCIQHEIDHLDGVLFVDRISALKRGMILRKLIKSKKLNGAAVG